MGVCRSRKRIVGIVVDVDSMKGKVACSTVACGRSASIPIWIRAARTTASLVSRVSRFRCGGRTVEINTSIESAWSTKLKFITFDLNIGIFDELQ